MKYESIYIKMDIFPEQLFSLISDYKREMNPTVFFYQYSTQHLSRTVTFANEMTMLLIF